ncbi:unnamed protein product [Rotaria sp. Silwood1]|nr:unnamed protein product [Rotaria sp. Silwood1]CAF1297136.1 unnamed protein product [Rotaria sp. Silwood1]CAF3505739.1 unnamed protein product [Rotaria sp. Silwood1]CAF3517512.1 unnamed protein product [Rotaria sp. Silwood1]CAF4766500.1 unnamed protein product [Rotaria sp. Silwood1]
MFNSCPGYLDDLGVWNNGFSCQPINNRVRVCCGPENRRECCFVDQLSHRSDLSFDSDLSSSLNKNESPFGITPSSYTFILIAIGLTLVLLIVLLITFIYVVRRKLNGSSSSSSSSCSSDTSSINKHCRRLSVTVASSSKSNASSPVPSSYVDYWSRTIISPSEWTLSKPYNSFIGGQPSNNHNYYID